MATKDIVDGSTACERPVGKIHYPSSDGQYLVGSGWHRFAILCMVHAVEQRFIGRRHVHAST